ncbi:DUF1697 domain-containing protein [Allosphingosinicella sp.]|uniref:DUF1697 domain-containing protein n=1 Tax=Allosphingosinicella sp. TaxID=2823234 RepID=UPI003785126A
MTRMVALLRAVNVGGRKLPMADFRQHVAGLGWQNVATYIQSGNLVFDADCSVAEAEAAIEALIRKQYGYDAPAMVRTRDQWAGYPGGNPFPDAARDTPGFVLMLIAKAPLKVDAAELLQARATAGEQVRKVGETVWIHFPQGSGTSKITPALMDKAMGSTATSRNYRTVCTLLDMLDG